MNMGDFLLRFSFISALGAAAAYAISARSGRERAMAPILFLIHTGCLVIAVAVLSLLFLEHRFEYSYVAQFSSRSLSPALSLAASWAGQEGSILLWSMLAALAGVGLMLQPGTLRSAAMLVTSLFQAGLTYLMLPRSPFTISLPAPADGHGLNPLLQDPWMVVHPPVLFLGYAALLPLFALAVAALLRRDYAPWLRAAWPWSLFAMLSLGAGIGLGGVWAYRVLGWGGYWGWDPVENVSLIPWLLSVALVHGMLIQRTTGSAARTNLMLSLLGWITVLGGTYLTRSGVLQDFSVHSFADSGLGRPLTVMLGLTSLVSVGLLGWRWNSVKTGTLKVAEVSRSSALWLGLLTVSALAALVSLGTLTPLLTRWMGQPASVQANFYNRVSLPLAVAITLLMALAPALRWGSKGATWREAGLLPSLVLGVLVVGFAFWRGVHEWGLLLLVGVAGLALGVNAFNAARAFRQGWAKGAGYLGHVGIAVMVAGMVASSSLSRSEKVRLVPGTPAEALGCRLTYSGTATTPRGERQMLIRVEGKGWGLDARPALLPSPNGEGTMRKPAISARHDFYLSPVDFETPAAGSESEATWLAKDQDVRVGNSSYRFLGFRMTSHEDMKVFADLEVTTNGKMSRIAPGMRVSPAGREPLDAVLPDGGVLSLSRIDADHGRVAIGIPGGVPALPAALVEVSFKPFINLVWMGALLSLVGMGLAGARRAVLVATSHGA